MTASVIVDTSDLGWLARGFRKLPKEMQDRVIVRSMNRVGKQLETRLARNVAQRIKIPQKHVKAVLRSYYRRSDTSLVLALKSGWIPLIDLGATQGKKGVSVRGRKQYKGAFITTVRRAGATGTHSGHEGVFRRKEGVARLPIVQQFGPNPAHAVLRKDGEYLQLALDDADQLIMPRLVHELNRALGELSRGG